MPHDFNGQPLKEGDLILIPARIKKLHEGQDYCNATVNLCREMPPDNTITTFSINTKQCHLSDVD